MAVVPFWSGDPGRSDLEGLALTAPDADGDAGDPGGAGRSRQALWVRGSTLVDTPVAAEMGRLLGSEGPGVVTYQAKELGRSLLGLRRGHDGASTRRRGCRLPARPVDRSVQPGGRR